MGTTSKGIFYPSDYSEDADLISDLQAMANSINSLFTNLDSNAVKSVSMSQDSQLRLVYTIGKLNNNYISYTVNLGLKNHLTNISCSGTTLTVTKADGTTASVDVSSIVADYYTKAEVDAKISAVYIFKGSVATYEDLPSSDLTVGDVYNVESDGSNYAWTGTGWDKLGGDIDLSGYQTKIDALNKLSSDLVDDTNHTNKFVTAEEKAQITTNKTDIATLNGEVSILNGLVISKNINKYDLTKAVMNYFAMTADYNVYSTYFNFFSVSTSPNGTKQGINANYSITPATDTVQEVNTYPMQFDTFTANCEVDEQGNRWITAIKGMPNFKDKGSVNVFEIFRTRYWKIDIGENGWTLSMSFVAKDGFTIQHEAINKDGTFNNWVAISKYVAGTILDSDNVQRLYSSKGLVPARKVTTPTGAAAPNVEMSYTANITKFKRSGTYYTGGLMSEYMFLHLLMCIEFATLSSQSVMAGVTNYSSQSVVALAETNVKRVLLTTANGANFKKYACVSVGDKGNNSSTDRVYGYMHSIVDDARVLSVENIEIGGTTYTALNLDVEEAFDTTATTYVSSFHEVSGYSDLILGKTGSPVSLSDGKHGCVYHGVEFMVGGYEVGSNAVMIGTSDGTKRDCYLTNDATKLTDNITTLKQNYIKTTGGTEMMSVSATGAWKYISKEHYDLTNGVMFATEAGVANTSSSTGYGDAQYFDNVTSDTTAREFLLLGYPGNEGASGLARVGGGDDLGDAHWGILSRLSINCIGGELAA